MLQEPGFRFHHLGVACRDLARELDAWSCLGYRPEGGPFVDLVQKIQGQFVTGAGPRLELLAPAGPDSPLEPYLARGVKLYHHAFEVAGFDDAIEQLHRAGAHLTSGPVPAVAFGGRRIAFLMTPVLNLIELVERP